MTAFEHILDGIEAELQLERELGVRAFAFDRSLLTSAPPPVVPVAAPPPAAPVAAPPPVVMVATPAPVQNGRVYDFIFIHDSPFSPGGRQDMAAITAKLGRTEETAPIVIEKPIPKAKVYVILGDRALKKFKPTMRFVPGNWHTTEKGALVFMTYSPEYFRRWKELPPGALALKKAMWLGLKSILKRI